MKTTKEKIEIMQFHEDGGAIEAKWNTSPTDGLGMMTALVLPKGFVWHKATNPDWNWENKDFRIKSLIHPKAKEAIEKFVEDNQPFFVQKESGTEGLLLYKEAQKFIFSLGIGWICSGKSVRTCCGAESFAVDDRDDREYRVMHTNIPNHISAGVNLKTGEVTHPTKKMTMEELNKELGYDVEIVEKK